MHLLLANNSAGGAGGAGAFEAIASATGTGSSNTITFSSIPSTYQHLHLRGIVRGDSGTSCNINIQLNSDSGSNYSVHDLYGTGSSVSAGGGASQTSINSGPVGWGSSVASDIVGAFIIDIHDYASTSKYTTVKGFTGRDKNDAGFLRLFSGAWLNTAAVDSITLTATAGNFTNLTQIALYGIKGA